MLRLHVCLTLCMCSPFKFFVEPGRPSPEQTTIEDVPRFPVRVLEASYLTILCKDALGNERLDEDDRFEAKFFGPSDVKFEWVSKTKTRQRLKFEGTTVGTYQVLSWSHCHFCRSHGIASFRLLVRPRCGCNVCCCATKHTCTHACICKLARLLARSHTFAHACAHAYT